MQISASAGSHTDAESAFTPLAAALADLIAILHELEGQGGEQRVTVARIQAVTRAAWASARTTLGEPPYLTAVELTQILEDYLPAEGSDSGPAKRSTSSQTTNSGRLGLGASLCRRE